MLLQNPFAAIATTGVDAIVLEVLTRADKSFTVNEILKLQQANASRNALRNALERFVEQGVVSEQRFGNTSIYSLNREHVLAEPLLQVAGLKARIVEKLAEDVSRWPVEPLSVQIFGSAARNEMRTDSDIDLLIVIPDDWTDADDHIESLCGNVVMWTGNDVQPLVYHEHEVEEAPIFREISREGIHVAGQRDWLDGKLLRRQATA